MKVKITTGERAKGLLGNKIERYVKCEITLTPEEQAVFPDSGVASMVLTTSYFDRDEYDSAFDGIRLQNAVRPGGALHVVGSIGQLFEKEQQCLQNCRTVQQHLEVLKGYDIEKSYEIDLEAELQQQS